MSGSAETVFKNGMDMIYLAVCALHDMTPADDVMEAMDFEQVYRLVKSQTMAAVTFYGLELWPKAKTVVDAELYSKWKEAREKAVRKNLLFDIEREKLFGFMEEKGIWYMPLKGSIMKELYPQPGMRQMADNDILFDPSFCNEVQMYMVSEGYESVSVGTGNHDVYKKKPVYNFELHRALYGEVHEEGWVKYYERVKDRLILSEGTSFGYHFSDEDFYVYIISHAYTHYARYGIGIRTLLDFYVYLNIKPGLDFSYIEKECEILGIAEFESLSRSLCKKVFDGNRVTLEVFSEKNVSDEEKQLLMYYFTSGTYGTLQQGITNKIKELRKKGYGNSKLRYAWNRLFPGYDTYKYYAPSVRWKFLQSVVGWFRRIFIVAFTKKRRKDIAKEIDVLKNVE